MSEESTQTNISSLENEGLPVRQHPLPWILFGVAVVALVLTTLLLGRRVSLETRRVDEEIGKTGGLKAQLAELRRVQDQVDARIASAESKVKAAEDAQTEAATKLKAVEAERDKLQKELEAAKKSAAATAEAQKAELAKKGKTATKSKKKKRRR